MFLVTLACAMDDLPVRLFDSEEDALTFARSLASSNDDLLEEALDVANDASNRDASILIAIQIWQFYGHRQGRKLMSRVASFDVVGEKGGV